MLSSVRPCLRAEDIWWFFWPYNMYLPNIPSSLSLLFLSVVWHNDSLLWHFWLHQLFCRLLLFPCHRSHSNSVFVLSGRVLARMLNSVSWQSVPKSINCVLSNLMFSSSIQHPQNTVPSIFSGSCWPCWLHPVSPFKSNPFSPLPGLA